MNLLSSVASNIVSIDLKNLVTKPEVENIYLIPTFNVKNIPESS